MKLAQDADIPYLRVDATIVPFVNAIEAYLKKRNGTDAALIFQNESGKSFVRVI